MLPSRLTEDAVLEEVWQPQPDKWAGYGGRRLVLGNAALVFPNQEREQQDRSKPSPHLLCLAL